MSAERVGEVQFTEMDFSAGMLVTARPGPQATGATEASPAVQGKEIEDVRVENGYACQKNKGSRLVAVSILVLALERQNQSFSATPLAPQAETVARRHIVHSLVTRTSSWLGFSWGNHRCNTRQVAVRAQAATQCDIAPSRGQDQPGHQPHILVFLHGRKHASQERRSNAVAFCHDQRADPGLRPFSIHGYLQSELQTWNLS